MTRYQTLLAIFHDNAKEVSQAFKMLIHNLFTEWGINIPDFVLTSESLGSEIMISRPSGEKAINVDLVNERFAQWIHKEIKNRPLNELQRDVHQFLYPKEEFSERGSHICQLITVLFLIDATFEGNRYGHTVHDRYMIIFGEIFPEELPPEVDTVITREDIFELLYGLRNSLKSLSVPGNIELRFVNSNNVFDVFVESNEICRLVIYANEFYKKLVGHIYAWEAANRANPDYMPNRIDNSFNTDD